MHNFSPSVLRAVDNRFLVPLTCSFRVFLFSPPISGCFSVAFFRLVLVISPCATYDKDTMKDGKYLHIT